MSLTAPATDNLTEAEKRDAVAAVLASQTFSRSEQLRHLLQYLCEAELQGQGGELNEYRIAVEALGRPASYSPAEDGVVRNRIYLLRNKLEEYYKHEGQAATCRIVLPKGTYQPKFCASDGQILDTTEQQIVHDLMPTTTVNHKSTPASPSIIAPNPTLRRLRYWQGATTVLALLALGLSYLLLLSSRKPLAGKPPTPSPAIRAFWGKFLESPQPTLLVYSNALFERHPIEKTYMRQTVSIETYELEREKQFSPQLVDSFGGVAEATSSHLLGTFLTNLAHPSYIKRSRLVTWDEIKNVNLIVLGSPAQNIFLRDLPQPRTFAFQIIPGKGFGIVNLRPQAGEPSDFFADPNNSSLLVKQEDYALITFQKGLGDRNWLLNLAGISTVGTQAATEYVTRPEYLAEMIQRLNTATQPGEIKLPAAFELVVKVKINGGVPVQVSYQTHHTIP